MQIIKAKSYSYNENNNNKGNNINNNMGANDKNQMTRLTPSLLLKGFCSIYPALAYLLLEPITSTNSSFDQIHLSDLAPFHHNNAA